MVARITDGNGGETTFRLALSTVVGASITIMVSIITAIIVWVFALQATVSSHESKIAVMVQIDSEHKSALDELKCDLKDIKPVIFEIREDQKRREKKER